MIVFYF